MTKIEPEYARISWMHRTRPASGHGSVVLPFATARAICDKENASHPELFHYPEATPNPDSSNAGN